MLSRCSGMLVAVLAVGAFFGALGEEGASGASPGGAAVDFVSDPKNIVVFYVDDLRPDLGGFGQAVHTPHLDAFMAESVSFMNAMVQQAVCSPSRTSLLTGCRPQTTQVFDLWTYFREVDPEGWNITTLPEFFKNAGYGLVGGQGKVFHPGHASGNDDTCCSWTEPYFHAPAEEEQPWVDRLNRSWIALDRPESDFPDAQVVTHGIAQIDEGVRRGKPWFVAIGVHKPHLPFIFPQPYLDLYPPSAQHLPNNSFFPRDAPDIAWSDWGELRQYHDIAALNLSTKIANDMPDAVTLQLRRAYKAAVSYTDNQFGRVVAALKSRGLWNSTIVGFWGDHGWQLNEHAEWCKHTNFELAIRAPLLLRSPEHEAAAGAKIWAATEMVDVYPTLVDLAGFAVPAGLQGASLRPFLENPDLSPTTPAFSQYPRETTPGNGTDHDFPHAMGASMRTPASHPLGAWRYTLWTGFNKTGAGEFDWTDEKGEELYSHHGDDGSCFECFENQNLAAQPDLQHIKLQLKQQLLAGPFNVTAQKPPYAQTKPTHAPNVQGVFCPTRN